MTERFYFQNLLGNKEFTATLTHYAILQKNYTFREDILDFFIVHEIYGCLEGRLGGR